MSKSKVDRVYELEQKLSHHLREAINAQRITNLMQQGTVDNTATPYYKELEELLTYHKLEAAKLREKIHSIDLPPQDRKKKENPVISWLITQTDQKVDLK